MAEPQVWLAGPQAWLAGPEGGQTNGRTDKQTENLLILQDFVPYQGRCPTSPHEKQKVEQGKGTTDHLMPLGYLFLTNRTVFYKTIPS